MHILYNHLITKSTTWLLQQYQILHTLRAIQISDGSQMLKIAHSSADNPPPFSGLLTIKLINLSFDEVPYIPDKRTALANKNEMPKSHNALERKKGRNVTSLQPF